MNGTEGNGFPFRGRGEEVSSEPGERPRVIVDFEVGDDDVLEVVVRNIGSLPATRVRVRFFPGFRGLGGRQLIPRLPVFRRLAFLSPAREVRVLVDPLAHYLKREPPEPRMIRVVIRYRDLSGRRYRTRLRHDLRIWEDLPRRKANRDGDVT